MQTIVGIDTATHPSPAFVPSRRVALRFVCTRPGTYLAIAGEVGHRVRYTVTGHRFTWCAELSCWVPGLDWVAVAGRTFRSLKAGQRWCEDAARQDGTLAPLAVPEHAFNAIRQSR
jgi:hypothetical protein